MVALEENRSRDRSLHFRHKGFAESAMEAGASWSVPLRLFRPYVRRHHLRSYCSSLVSRNNRGRLAEVMVVEDCRIQRILRTAKAKAILGDREGNSRRSHLEHGCMKNRDVRLGGLISGERRSGQPKVNNYGEEG